MAWNEGFLGDRFTSVPLPKAWMAFPVGKESRQTQRNQGPLHHSALCHPKCDLPCDSPELGAGWNSSKLTWLKLPFRELPRSHIERRKEQEGS